MIRAFHRLIQFFNYNERRRQIDLQILWPTLKERARDLDHAKAAFAYHCLNDPAWQPLGEDEIMRRIEALT